MSAGNYTSCPSADVVRPERFLGSLYRTSFHHHGDYYLLMRKTPDFLRVIPGGMSEATLPEMTKNLTLAEALSWTNYSAAIAEMSRDQIVKQLEAREDKAPALALVSVNRR